MSFVKRHILIMNPEHGARRQMKNLRSKMSIDRSHPIWRNRAETNIRELGPLDTIRMLNLLLVVPAKHAHGAVSPKNTIGDNIRIYTIGCCVIHSF